MTSVVHPDWLLFLRTSSQFTPTLTHALATIWPMCVHSVSLCSCRLVVRFCCVTMLEEIDLWLIGSVTVAAAQFGTSVRDVYRSWRNRNRKPKPTDYERVINGATINGWSLAFPAMAGLNKDTNEMIVYGFVDPVFIDPDGKWYPAAASDSMITLHFKHPDPSGSTIHSIHQYSVVNATEKIWHLFSIRYKPWKMKHVFSAFVTSNTIMTALRVSPHVQGSMKQFKVIMFDTRKPMTRSFLVEAPADGSRIMCAYAVNWPKTQLHIVYYADIDDGDGASSIEFYDCKCDDPFGKRVTWQWESILVPVGNRSSHYSFNTGSAVVFVAYDDAHLNDADDHICISFNHAKIWRKETMTEWLASNRNDEAKIKRAAEAFSALSPPIEFGVFDVPALRYFNRMPPHGSSVLFLSDCEGVLRRWISPPSLLQLAIDALIKSNPGLKMEELKMLLGDALFWAIFGEESEISGECDECEISEDVSAASAVEEE